MIKTKYISKVGKDYKISEHFTLGEFASPIKKGSSERADKVLYSTALLKKLEEIRAHFGGPTKITSGYRNKTYNTLILGDAKSAHMDGKAADFEQYDEKGKLVPPREVCLYIEATKWKWGIGMMNSATHIDTKFAGSRMDERTRPYDYFGNRGITFADFFGFPKMKVDVDVIHVFSKPSTDSQVLAKIKRGKLVQVFATVKKDGVEYAKIDYIASKYVVKDHLTKIKK